MKTILLSSGKFLYKYRDIVLFAAGIIIILYYFTDIKIFFLQHTDTEKPMLLKDVFALLVQIAGGIFIWWGLRVNNRRVIEFQKQNKHTQQHNKLIEDGNITERFKTAIEQIGNESSIIRMGGFYSLERIARQSVDDVMSIQNIICAYLREMKRIKVVNGKEKPSDNKKEVGLNELNSILAILTKNKRDNGEYLFNSENIDLSEADLRYANLERANLEKANLERANLKNTNLLNANFKHANLRQAIINNNLLSLNNYIKNLSDINKKDLFAVDFEYANFFCANMENANFYSANLKGADLRYANLKMANLKGANIRYADINKANFIGTENHLTELTIEQYQDIKSQFPENDLSTTIIYGIDGEPLPEEEQEKMKAVCS